MASSSFQKESDVDSHSSDTVEDLEEELKASSLIVVLNTSSGAGSRGKPILDDFICLLGHKRVCNLRQTHERQFREWIQKHIKKSMKKGQRLKILVAGGDGTVSFVCKEIKALPSKQRPILCVLPLGTGNEIARMCGWSPGLHTAERETIVQVAHKMVEQGEARKIDTFTVNVSPLHMGQHPDENCRSWERLIALHLTMGVDAESARLFHVIRQRHPNLCSSRAVNMLIYAISGLGLCVLTQPRLSRVLTLKVDGRDIALPDRVRTLVCLNVPGYAAGTQIWDCSGTTYDKKWRRSQQKAEFKKTQEDRKPLAEEKNDDSLRRTSMAAILSHDTMNVDDSQYRLRDTHRRLSDVMEVVDQKLPAIQRLRDKFVSTRFGRLVHRALFRRRRLNLETSKEVFYPYPVASSQTSANGMPQRWRCQDPSDGKLEILGFFSLWHFALVKLGFAKALQLAQGSHIEIEWKKESREWIALQADGEPFRTGPCKIDISLASRIAASCKPGEDIASSKCECVCCEISGRVDPQTSVKMATENLLQKSSGAAVGVAEVLGVTAGSVAATVTEAIPEISKTVAEKANVAVSILTTKIPEVSKTIQEKLPEISKSLQEFIQEKLPEISKEVVHELKKIPDVVETVVEAVEEKASHLKPIVGIH